ncbi:MAG TPA: EamA family transporter, partial [Myxococcota bacterium]
CLWGLWSLCFRTAEHLSSAPLSGGLESFVVYLTMFVALTPFALADTRARSRDPSSSSLRAPVRPGDIALLLFLGATDGLNGLCYFSALQKTTVAVAVLTHYLQPLLTAIIAPLFLPERWRGRTFIALAIALSGLALLLRPWESARDSDVVGAALGALSAVFFSIGVLSGKALAQRFSTWELAAYPKVAAFAVVSLAVPTWSIELAPLAVLIGGGVAFGAVPLVLFYRGLARTSASQAAVLTLCEPLVAVVVGVAAWGEALAPLGVLGGALVLGGAALIASRSAALSTTTTS